MSYTISDLKSDNERREQFARELEAAFPDARIGDGDRWYSESLTREDCDVFRVEARDDRGATNTVFGKRLPSGCVVWCRSWLHIGRSLQFVTDPELVAAMKAFEAKP